MKYKRIIIISLCVILAVFIYGFRCDLKTVHYKVKTNTLDAPMHFAVIGDLHSCLYGKGQSKLIKAIDKQNPDAILLTGDIFDDEIPNDNTKLFFENIKGKYPCYYVTGNHECWTKKKKFNDQMKILEDNGVIRLCGESVIFEKDGSKINICGVDDKDIYMKRADGVKVFESQLEKAQNECEDNVFSVLLAHRPEEMKIYKNYNFDLILCGHAHGGQWRVPFLINGVYAPYQGFLPKYAGGEYKEDNAHMLVTRGLATNEEIPRYYNRPELVIVDLV